MYQMGQMKYKLKPFGFSIHRCIDGFNRRILWFKVASTNNNPMVIASYFIHCFNNVKKVPKVIQADRETFMHVVGNVISEGMIKTY